MAEKSIHTTTLEQYRRRVNKQTKRQFQLPALVLGAMLVYSFCRYGGALFLLASKGWGDVSALGGFFQLLGSVLLSLMMAGAVFCAYHILVWGKSYQLFCDSFKNHYLLQIFREMPGFSDVQYRTQGGFSYEEIARLGVIPLGVKSCWTSSDLLTGQLGRVPFCCGHVTAAHPSQGRSSTPQELFSGQVMVFSLFDQQKSSRGMLQILDKKAASRMAGQLAPHLVETENTLFNQRFSVYAQDAHNAFYILTPPVMERILEFSKEVEGEVCLSFSEERLAVACRQQRNLFDPWVDIPVEEQTQQLGKGAAALGKAREILVNLPVSIS